MEKDTYYIELANAYSMLPYAFLAFVFEPWYIRTSLSIAWIISYYHHIYAAYNNGVPNMFLYFMDICGQIITNFCMAFANQLYSKHKIYLLFPYTLFTLGHTTNIICRKKMKNPKTISVLMAGLSYTTTIVYCGVLLKITHASILDTNLMISTSLMITSCLFLNLSRKLPYLWSLGHLTILAFTVFIGRALQVPISLWV